MDVLPETNMDERLKKASQLGDINALYALIKEDSEVLDSVDQKPFVDTPLHIAASLGNSDFAMEVMVLYPSFAKKLNQDGLSPMHLALQNGRPRLVCKLVAVDGELVRVKGRKGLTSLHYVAREGNLSLLTEFLSLCPKSIEDVSNHNETALHIALKNDKFDAFRAMLSWLQRVSNQACHNFEQKILNCRDEEGNSVLHIAALKNQHQASKMLVRSAMDLDAKNLAGFTPLDIAKQNWPQDYGVREALIQALSLKGSTITFSMDQRLMKTAQVGDIVSLYKLVSSDAHILEHLDQLLLADTPLHVAASAGQTLFAIELMNLKPSFAKKLNKDGFSPVHLALQCDQKSTALRMLEVERKLARVHGREGKTPLHYVVEKGDVNLLAEFLKLCPESIQDMTNKKETILHIAAKHQRLEALQVILGWLKLLDVNFVINWSDDEGNTVLHVATTNNDIQMVKLLAKEVNINALNLRGHTALDVLESLGQEDNAELKSALRSAGAKRSSSLSEAPSLVNSLKKKMSSIKRLALANYRARLGLSNDDRNAVIVVCTLIASATYQALGNPPKVMKDFDYDKVLKDTHILLVRMFYPSLQSWQFDANAYTTNTDATLDSSPSPLPAQLSSPINPTFDLCLQILSISLTIFLFTSFFILNSLAFFASMREILRNLPDGLHNLKRRMIVPLINCYIVVIACSLLWPYVFPGVVLIAVIFVVCWKIGKIKRGKSLLDKSLPEKGNLFKHYVNLRAEARNHQPC